MAVLIASYLLLVFMVPVLLSGIVTWRALPRGRTCPQCGGDSVPLQSRRLRSLRALLGRIGVSRRWCPRCGWEGLARRGTDAAPAAPVAAPGPEADRPVLALDVRSLRVDGRLWRVQLQSWREPECCQGRLVFIEPSGRHLRDAVQSFTGATQFEVLGQALSVPDRLLASRLRQLLTTDS